MARPPTEIEPWVACFSSFRKRGDSVGSGTISTLVSRGSLDACSAAKVGDVAPRTATLAAASNFIPGFIVTPRKTVIVSAAELILELVDETDAAARIVVGCGAL